MASMNQEKTEANAANPMDQIEKIKKMVSDMGINLGSPEGLNKMKELAASMGVDANMIQPDMMNKASEMLNSFTKK